ncbi:GAF and ANTAR domain-containing protein [Arthrobacter sp. ISL-48]|uniref:GAF and ANTAR domain-containing protein n=1 Tax=Arthrobacter sp. ISL-48 TaxID=2819110 RepID=UPI001BEAB7EE|nr:GAF and ANTAR domain-containing protein [Arthrobacter sp. ISL-48]MBT2534376.1 GAF and ANTAR domain-containing protein [Arthrobacter sp. ISL-48]
MVAAEVSEHEVFTDVAQYLQDLVLGSPEVEGFLGDLAVYSAARLSDPGRTVSCGISVFRKKKTTTTASSSPCARLMDQLQHQYDDGPCLTVMRDTVPVLVPDLRLEKRWPAYVQAAKGLGILSVVGVPLPLEKPSQAVLNLYSEQPHAFSGQAIARAETFAGQASKGLQLALRLGQLQETRDDMKAAMKSRTVIDLATGAIMAKNRCSQNTAFKVLLHVSNTQNIKLNEVAARVVSDISGTGTATTYFDE